VRNNRMHVKMSVYERQELVTTWSSSCREVLYSLPIYVLDKVDSIEDCRVFSEFTPLIYDLDFSIDTRLLSRLVRVLFAVPYALIFKRDPSIKLKYLKTNKYLEEPSGVPDLVALEKGAGGAFIPMFELECGACFLKTCLMFSLFMGLFRLAVMLSSRLCLFGELRDCLLQIRQIPLDKIDILLSDSSRNATRLFVVFQKYVDAIAPFFPFSNKYKGFGGVNDPLLYQVPITELNRNTLLQLIRQGFKIDGQYTTGSTALTKKGESFSLSGDGYDQQTLYKHFHISYNHCLGWERFSENCLVYDNADEVVKMSTVF
jgi:hypothetical protein